MFKPMTILALMFAGMAVGCANVNVHRVKPDDYTTEGVRYWLSAPYLLVKAPVEVARSEELYELDRGAGTLTPVCRTGRCGQDPETQGPAGPRAIPLPPPKHGSLLLDAPWDLLKAKASPADGKKPANAGANDSGAAGAAAGGAAAPVSPNKVAKAADSPAPEAKAPSTDAISITWLPDYCEQYAMDSTNILATQTLNVKLANGWQLDSMNSTSDSTAVMSKLLETIGTVAAAALGKSGGSAAGSTGSTGSTGSKVKKGEQAGQIVLLRRTVTTIVKPGIYPLTLRDKGACTSAPVFSFSALEYEYGDAWVELTLADAKSAAAAADPVEVPPRPLGRLE